MKNIGRCCALVCVAAVAAAAGAAAQQNSNPNQNPAANPAHTPTEVQPQVWPPPAQPSKEPQPPGPATPSAAQQRDLPAGRIRVNVVVTNKAGKPVTGLGQQDFTLLDDNHPMPIAGFRAYTPATVQSNPVQIILIIDSVNLDFQDVTLARIGIDAFLRKDGGRLAEPVSIYWYTDSGLEPLEPANQEMKTTDGNALAARLDATEGRLRRLTRSAGAWGAIERYQMSVQMVDRVARLDARSLGRKLIVWIGPGWPMLDGPNMEMNGRQQQNLFRNIVALSTILREGQIELSSVTQGLPDMNTYLYESYVKGVKKASQALLPNLALKVLATESGGLALPPSNDLTAGLRTSTQDAAAYYTIGFDPPAADGPDEYHALKVKVDKPGLTARTNTGYYNQPPGAAPAQ